MSRVTLPTAAGGANHRRVRYVRSIDELAHIPEAERGQLRRVAETYVFRANDYYLELIDWNDPDDPIKQLIIPRVEELSDWGKLDASNEARYTVAQGVQHKYPDTVLLLCNEVCGAYCRYCFRKRLFMDDNDEVTKDVSEGIRYIAAHPEVNNVLLTGGDPLLMSTRRLREIIEALAGIEHVRIIRIGSKMPAFDPFRILHDAELRDLLGRHSSPRQRIYLMAHFDHPRELTDAAVEGLDAYIRLGVICVNQCPLIRGVNDDPEVLGELYRRLSWIGCPPYYLFQGRPTAGNEPYEVPIVRGWDIFREALRHGSGLARRARYCMSHETGKVEISGVDEQYIYLRYHRARDPRLRGRLMLYHRDDNASWLDGLRPAEDTAGLPFGADSLLDVTSGPE
ncbi:MAG: 4Fe-4S cluster-binding domain-containing protein [Phycisphaerae bacterium]|nr:radical SAM protein [Phycisphaerae bacterium]MCZ2398242.1 4Fe-4S cluster-binding domain-containing protein [Phycisphaerae bacterium]NUQ50987.1 radical SAM protein [Phycisphaerae bacterium]